MFYDHFCAPCFQQGIIPKIWVLHWVRSLKNSSITPHWTYETKGM